MTYIKLCLSKQEIKSHTRSSLNKTTVIGLNKEECELKVNKMERTVRSKAELRMAYLSARVFYLSTSKEKTNICM